MFCIVLTILLRAESFAPPDSSIEFGYFINIQVTCKHQL